ncbi:MAG: hypothetical protein R3E66_20540 [bacterium]
MARFFSYFETPVGTRPDVLVRVVALVFAFDVWANSIRRGHSMGFGDFNVAQFAWLDAVLPIPTAASFMAALLVASFAAASIVVLGATRALVVVLLASWGYAWAASYLDGYQHHYFLVLVVVCFLGMRPAAEAPSGRRWGYHLLCLTVANMYLFAAIAKTDALWVSGERLRAIFASRQPYAESAFAALGLASMTGWQVLSIGTIVLEVALAAIWVLAPAIANGRYAKLGWSGVAMGLSLHVGAELLGLEIEWFSCYMLALTLVCLTPVWPNLRTIADAVLRRRPHAATRRAETLWTLVAVVTVAGFLLPADLPGMIIAWVGISAGLAVAWGLRFHARTIAVVSMMAAGCFAVTANVSQSRYDYWRLLGATHYRSARAQATPTAMNASIQSSIEAYTHAQDHAPAGKDHQDVLNTLRKAQSELPR